MNTRLKPPLFSLVAAASLQMLAGCASTPEVQVIFDRSINFAQYQTFGFATPLGTDRESYQSLTSQYLITATQREMEARGMRLVSSDPQLLVNFKTALSERVYATTLPAPTFGVGVGMGGGGYHGGYRMGMYGAWPLYVDPTMAAPYETGILKIDIIDAARKQTVWEGVVSNIVTPDLQDNLQGNIDIAIAAAFAQYPVPVAIPPK